MKINKATLHSVLRAAVGVLVGVALYLANEPKYSALGALVPFVIRWANPSDKEITFGKTIASDVAEATGATKRSV